MKLLLTQHVLLLLKAQSLTGPWATSNTTRLWMSTNSCVQQLHFQHLTRILLIPLSIIDYGQVPQTVSHHCVSLNWFPLVQQPQLLVWFYVNPSLGSLDLLPGTIFSSDLVCLIICCNFVLLSFWTSSPFDLTGTKDWIKKQRSSLDNPSSDISSNPALKPRLLSHKKLCMLGSQVAFVLSEAQINYPAFASGWACYWTRNPILRQNPTLHSDWLQLYAS